MNVRLHSRGEDVKSVQEVLKQLGFSPGLVDGHFGEKTEKAVIAFQEDTNLYADGIVGPNTWSELRKAQLNQLEEQLPPIPEDDDEESGRLPWVRVPATKFRDGFDRFFLREDAAAAYLKVREMVTEAGGIITSSGAKRALTARVSPSRSATSFHYTGRALDLHVGSGMENRGRDHFVIASDGDRYWRVYARAPGGQQMEINAFTHGSRNAGKPVTGNFVDLTALFQEQGFQRIRARRSYFDGGTWLGAEWWHFQFETGLEEDVTTFGSELLRVYSEDTLRNTPPWKFRNRVFGRNWN